MTSDFNGNVHPPQIVPPRQSGFFLIEALIAVVIFSIGILAVIGLQAVALRETTESKMRSDASYLADKIIGDLSTADLQTASTSGSTIATSFNGTYTATVAPSGADTQIYTSWQNLIGRDLPNGQANVAIVSTVDPLSTSKVVYSATVTISWVLAGAPRSLTQNARLVD